MKLKILGHLQQQFLTLKSCNTAHYFKKTEIIR